MRSSLNNFILDGIDNNSYGTSNQGFSNQVVQVSPDAVEEFKVQTNNFSAEYGRAGGAVINATFRSGTNAVPRHGVGVQPQHGLNATGFFKPSSGEAGVEPQPVRRRLRRSDPPQPLVLLRQLRRLPPELSTVTFSSMPTVALRQGHMGSADRQPADRRGLRQRRRSRRRRSRRSRAQVLDGLPAPTRPGISNNFDTLPLQTDENNKVDVKVDQQFGGGTNALRPLQPPQGEQLRAAADPRRNGSPANAFVEVLNQQLALGVTRTLSTRSLLEVRFGVSRTEAGKSALGTGTPNMLERYGITGLPTDAFFAGGLTQQSVTGWTAWGRQSSNPQFQNPPVHDCRVELLVDRRPPHAEDRLRIPAHQHGVDDVHPKYGADNYGGQFSRPAGAAADPATYNLADFLMGARSGYELVNPFVFQPAPADALRLSAGRLARHAVADAEPRPALRVRRRRSGKTTTS